MAKQPRENPKHMTKIGGQALIEGVMMKGADTGAMACRLPTGEIDVETWAENNGKNMPWYRKCPFVRGSFSFVLSMKDGYRCLTKSAEKQVPPKFLIGQLISHTAIPDNSRFVRSLLEGIIKIAIFLGYMACTGLMKDIRRTYEYHGAEHKTIACYEAGEELTVENVKKHTRFHPRCGTSFIFITLIVSILVMCIVPIYQVLPRVIVSILLLPVVVGISYEFIRIAGKSNNWLTRALSWPGLQIQRITTREPDASQIECAIAALKPCIPEDMEDDKW